MEQLTLVIGNKNYSSWSLRPWLVLEYLGIPFEEVRIPLYLPESAEPLARWSPSGLVPALRDGAVTVWDSLAICEYLNERFPEQGLWPAEPVARAMARSISAEMHAGFLGLRSAMPMNCRSHLPGKGNTPESRQDVERIVALWTDCRARFGQEGEFLFGRFTLADAMYAPVVLRFRTYGVDLEGTAGDYVNSVYDLPAVQKWVEAARREPECIDRFEHAK